MPTRREMMIATAASVLGVTAGCASSETDTEKPMSEQDTDPFEVEVMDSDTTNEPGNGISELARVFDPETGVLMYATKAGDVHRSLKVEAFTPDEHNYEGTESTD